MRRDAPKVLFFHAGSVCSDAAYDMAYTIGSNIGFRNATAANAESSLEPAVAVSAVEPEDVPRAYYDAYPFVTTAKELVRAANKALTAEDNPARSDDPEEEDEEDEDEKDGMSPTEYDLAPYVPDTTKTDDENAALKAEWDQKEVDRVAMLPARDTLATDHPAYKAPSGSRRSRRKAPKKSDDANAPNPPASAPGWNNNA